MKALRIAVAIGTFLSFAIALNLLVMRRNAFDPLVMTLGGLTIVCGILWVILTIVTMAESSARRRSFAELNNIFASIIFLAICVVLYAMVKRWDQSWDLTKEGRRTLAPQTVQVLQNLNTDVTVLGLFTHTGARELDVARDKTQRFLEQCRKLAPGHLKVEYIDPQQELARLKAMNLTFADPQGTVVVRCGKRQKTIPFSGPQPRLEERDFTNALINVIQDKEPKVGFLVGHGELDITKPAGTGVKKLLQSEGYEVEPVAINVSDGSIPGDFDIIVIAGFKGGGGGDLNPKEIEALDTFMRGGGRMLIMVDPEFTVGAKTRRSIFTWLDQRFGIVVGDDLLVSGLQGQRFGEVTLLPDAAAVDMFKNVDLPDVKEFHGCFDQSIPITNNFDKRIDFLLARSLSEEQKVPKGVTLTEFLRTLPYTYAETNLEALREGKQPTQDPGEKVGSIGLGMAAMMKTDVPIGDSGQTRFARLVVIGDSDFVSNETILNGGNLNLLLNTMAWLSEREDLIAIRPRGTENQPIKLSPADERWVAWISTLGVLHLVAGAGVVTFLLRRKYQ